MPSARIVLTAAQCPVSSEESVCGATLLDPVAVVTYRNYS
jgi:hypothetical protein